MDNDKTQAQWYVLQALSGQENRVQTLINNRREQDMALGIDDGVEDVRIPIDRVETRRKSDNKAIIMERKRYPGYVLVKARLYQEDGNLNPTVWDLIKGTAGVIGFIGGEKPVQLPQADVDEMLRSEGDAEKPKPRIQYNIGETVLLKGSAFVGYEGVIEAIDNDRARLKVSVSMFGRSTPVEIGINEVERPL